MEHALVSASEGIALAISCAIVFFAATLRNNGARLSVEAKYADADHGIRIQIANAGSKAVDLTSLTLGYGVSGRSMFELFDLTGRIGTSTLPANESRTLIVSDEELRLSANRIRQGYYKRAWVRAKIAGGATSYHLVDVSGIASVPTAANSSWHFIATTKILGFAPLEPATQTIAVDRF
jgi:hypothetical protein